MGNWLQSGKERDEGSGTGRGKVDDKDPEEIQGVYLL